MKLERLREASGNNQEAMSRMITTLAIQIAIQSLNLNHHTSPRLNPAMDMTNNFMKPTPLAKPQSQYIVIARTGNDGDREKGCQILTEDATYTEIFSVVFGPDSFNACQEWVKYNCESPI